MSLLSFGTCCRMSIYRMNRTSTFGHQQQKERTRLNQLTTGSFTEPSLLSQRRECGTLGRHHDVNSSCGSLP
ncbi:hypothetical protein PR202_gb00030 [Eleusine coracana subsp. coracana]|uniref:Uncharacterized protein n=1 Tax=Eleusine coracana subsp. coracana TaxID=191504 RepID=A0AAV5DS60_ELECO|nr:hypothetical protein PR202_gb00030 [Eleusine coracana subsp. coracana]